MTIRAIAFDIHDTLAFWPPGRLRPIEIQRLLASFNIPISYQAYETARQSVFFFDAPKREIHGWVDFLALLFARLGATVSLDLLQSIAALYQQRDQMQIFPDAIPALESARAAGLLTCAFTTLPRFMLGDVGPTLISRLDHYLDASALGFAKGDPRFYAAIPQRLALQPHEILAVGDDPLGDVDLPREAGWNAVLLDRKGAAAVSSPHDPRTISSLASLPKCSRPSE